MCILIILEYPDFLLRSDIDIESKISGGGGGVQSEFRMLLVWAGSGAALLGSPGRGTGCFLFLPLCVLVNMPLVLGGIVMYLCLVAKEVFAALSVTREESIQSWVRERSKYGKYVEGSGVGSGRGERRCPAMISFGLVSLRNKLSTLISNN